MAKKSTNIPKKRNPVALLRYFLTNKVIPNKKKKKLRKLKHKGRWFT